MLFWEKEPLEIDDPVGYLLRSRPGLSFKKTRSSCIDESRVPAYVIEEYNGCAVNAAACLLTYASGVKGSFSRSLETCRSIAEKGYSKEKKGYIDYYIKLGTEAPFVRKCLRAGLTGFRASSSLFVKRRAISEILAGRPVLLNIGFSRQYTDHTVTAYGFEEYSEVGSGRKVLFFKIRDGYTNQVRYLEYRRILGISITYLKI